MKHVLVTLSWVTDEDGRRIGNYDPAWQIIQQIENYAQPSQAVIPSINGFNVELLVDDATAADMDTNSICTLIWAEAV